MKLRRWISTTQCPTLEFYIETLESRELLKAPVAWQEPSMDAEMESQRIFVFAFTGYQAPASSSGVGEFADKIDHDEVLAGHVVTTVVGWDVGRRPRSQKRHVKSTIKKTLHDAAWEETEPIVMIGHSYGGYLAWKFADKVPGVKVTAEAIVTLDPIDWTQCNPRKSQFLCDQSSEVRAAPTPETDVFNFVVRGPTSILNGDVLRGFQIDGGVQAEFFDTGHFDIDHDRGAGADGILGTGDDVDLGIYALVIDYLQDLSIDIHPS